MSTALAVIGGIYLKNDAVKDITGELITFFSIQSAVILPAMIFSAGILKPDGLELEDADRYHRALKMQMVFWVVLLALDFIAVVALIAGKALAWKLVLPIFGTNRHVDLGWIFPTVLYFSGSLTIFRTVPFVQGILSLLDLTSEMTQKAIKRRNKMEITERTTQKTSGKMVLPPGYGDIISSEDDR
ncbi:hypothetical protein [Gluconobacter sp. OJB]|uniref:hypothetical protein n=1 Tax=Gluconobacter sp. OJB TaxID=3145196 RepID=UPI0031F7F65C